MALDIRFIESDPEQSEGVHFVVDDGCDVYLKKLGGPGNEWADGISELQKNSSKLRHLVYQNKVISDVGRMFSPILIHCPICQNDYKITAEEYDSAFKEFQKSQLSPS